MSIVPGKEKRKGCREPRRKKRTGSSRNGKTQEDLGSAMTTQHIDVHPIPQVNGTNSIPATSHPPNDGFHAVLNSYTSSNMQLESCNTAPVRTRRGKMARSRQIDPPAYVTLDGAADFLEDADTASHSSNLGCINHVIDADSGSQSSHMRAADREYLLKPAGRLPPLDKV